MSGIALNVAVGAPLLEHVRVRPGMEPHWRALKEVLDPELPISVVDMGLIYDLAWRDEPGGDDPRTVVVTMTYTATACPCMELIEMDIRDALLEVDGVDAVEIDVVWSPAWHRGMITDEGKLVLRKYGVAA